jgi:hypothetical protein
VKRPSGDAGMTLVELLICLAVLMLVIAPLVMVLQFALGTAQAASQRTTDSSGAQLLSSYLVTDVQSAGFFWSPTDTTTFTGTYATRCGGANTRLELQSINATTGGVVATTYDATPVDATYGPTLIRRIFSVAGGSCSQTDSTSLVTGLSESTPPTAKCSPSCASADTVTLTVTAASKQVKNSSISGTYTFDVTATRRSS